MSPFMTSPEPPARRGARLRLPLILAGAAVLLCPLLAAPPAEAQTAVRRGAGSMERGAGAVARGGGARRGSDLGSRKTGGAAGTRSAVTTSRPTFRSPGSDAAPPAESTAAAEQTSANANGVAEDALTPNETEEEAAEAPVDFGARTLGKACMYGTRGEVIFRPRGATCRGDRSPSPARPNAARPRPDATRPSAVPAAPAARSDARRPAADRAAPRRAPAEPQKARGSCIFGGDGRVVYAPAGVDCRR
jgi:hypothetical protein